MLHIISDDIDENNKIQNNLANVAFALVEKGYKKRAVSRHWR